MFKHLWIVVGILSLLHAASADAAEQAEVNVFKGAAVVTVDGGAPQEVLGKTSFTYEKTITVRTPGAFAAMSVDMGELGFVRVDYGRVDVTVDADRKVHVDNHGGSVYVDECKTLIREGSGRWTIFK
jgi:hypothetical protein